MTTPELILDIQVVNVEDSYPSKNDFERWINQTLVLAHSNNEKPAKNIVDTRPETGNEQTHELSIRLVNEKEGSNLNQTYRDKTGPTNVLSFPFENPANLPPDQNLPLLGDIVICVPLVRQEALAQGKAEINHWAHLTIHGTLHLLGYDHTNDEEAQIMEQLETEILADLGFPDPYKQIAPQTDNNLH